MGQTYKRARTSLQKAQRRDAILEAAEDHLRSVGLDGFSMGVLAKNVGIARGTLYLYFETREEVLMTLHREQLAIWSSLLHESIYEGIDDAALLKNFKTAFMHDPLFAILFSRMRDVIEKNISLKKVIESKRFMNRMIYCLTDHISRCINLSQEKTLDLLISLLVLMVGISQIDNGPHIDPKLLPEDLRELASITSDDIYMNTGRFILSGIRLNDRPA